jgi:hypothetical protein
MMDKPALVETEEPLTSRGEKFEDLRRALRSEWEPWLIEVPAEKENDGFCPERNH